MEENTVKISHILFMILMMGIIIAVGTYAWLSYRSNDTAMVLTIGETNNVQVTLSPYQFKGSLLPQVTYTSDNYVNVTAINNSSSSRKIRLYYKINNIDSELTSSDFKYTIERSTDGTNYSEYKSGNFNGTSNGSELTILEENIPNTTTYNYKVYLWIDSTNSDQSYMQGKSFSGELRAEILSYNVTFDANGGIVNISNKAVSYGEQYGELPTPTREGYRFLGWNGKNMLNINVNSSLPSDTSFSNTTLRTFTPNTYVVGLAYNNYYNPGQVTSYNFNNNSINLVANAGYGIGYPLQFNYSGNYTLSYNVTSTVQVHSSLMYYRYNGSLIRYDTTDGTGQKAAIFTVPNDTYYLVLEFSSEKNTATFSNVQLEKGATATAYEPYFITGSTRVVQSSNHTLKAIWEPISQ